MAVNVNVAAVGHLLAAPARAAMLDALFDGGEWPVSDLARAARIAPSTASEHLELLRRGGLVTVVQDGRYRRSAPASRALCGRETTSRVTSQRLRSNGGDQKNDGITEMVEIPGRGHALTIDSGWRQVADTALEFVKRFV